MGFGAKISIVHVLLGNLPIKFQQICNSEYSTRIFLDLTGKITTVRHNETDRQFYSLRIFHPWLSSSHLCEFAFGYKFI